MVVMVVRDHVRPVELERCKCRLSQRGFVQHQPLVSANTAQSINYFHPPSSIQAQYPKFKGQ